MAESQYYGVLKQEDNSSEQQYFSNVEDQTVQYVITPNKTQTQFPTQQPRQHLKQVMRLNNPIQQIATNQIQMRANSPQAIPNQPQMRSPNPSQIQRPPPAQQLLLRQQLPVARPLTSGGHRSVGVVSAAQQIRHLNVGVVRQPVAGQQIRLTTLAGQLRPQTPRGPAVGQQRFQALNQIQQLQKAKSLGDMDDLENKSSVEQESVSLPDGSLVTVDAYKKMLADQKARNTPQKMNPPPMPTQNSSLPMAPPTPTAAAAKRRTPVNRNPRQSPKGGAKAQARSSAPQMAQFQSSPPSPQPAKDPSQFAMMNQHQPINKPVGAFQNQQQIQQQNQLLQQQQFQQQQQLQQQHQMQQQLQQQLAQEQTQQLRQSQANYVIQPPRANHKPQQQRPLPAYIPSSQIQKIIESTPISEEFSDSIRMLVLLENGEQRLITFTLPKEACTIQEILEQVNVPFQSHTNIQVTEANSNGINYIVTVGNVPPLGYEEDDSHQPPQQEDSCSSPAAGNQMPVQPQQQQSQPLQQTQQPSAAPPFVIGPPPLEVPVAPSSPEPPKEVPRLVPGMLALCGACGYLSEDFNKCIRCNRKLPDNVKAIPATIKSNNGQKKEILARHQAMQQKPAPIKNSPAPKPPSPVKKKSSKKQTESESVHVISSDEEDEEEPSKLNENILQKLGASVTISPVTKEPSMTDLQRHSSQNSSASTSDHPSDIITMKMRCRTVRIGSYRCVPIDEVHIDSARTVIQVPHPTGAKDVKTVTVEKGDVVKVLASFNSSLPVVFYYLSPEAAEKIRADLEMTVGGPYYLDPLALDEESQRRITLLPDDIDDADKNLMQLIFGQPPNVLDELNVKEANDILIKTCPKDLAKSAMGYGSFTEIKQLLTYPPEGKGRIAINTEDYICLGQDQFLNDVIIDFYLKYLVANLPEEQKPKVHVFSTFFYKRLTTKPTRASRKCQPAELDPTLSSAEKRHARVKTWTKNVNLFEKDFVVVPINENAHWFLAIICFPGLDGCQTWDGKPYKLEAKSTIKKKSPITSIGAVSVTAVKQEKAKPILCEDPEMSDKDEAEGDDSELESDDSEEVPGSQTSISPVLAPVYTPKGHKEARPAVKQPCILIFDSLAGANRSRVVATLRDYLTCEYKLKMGKERIYNKDVIKGANPKVPQQNNFTDCGLYVLQYVEQFFKDPIKDYNMPIKEIQNWFEEFVVTRKREEIADLLRSLMKEYGKDTRLLPDVSFPTLNGKVVDQERQEEERETMEDEDHSAEDETDMKEDESFVSNNSKSDMFSETGSSTDETRIDEDSLSPIKPSNDGVSGDFLTQTIMNSKPDLSEFPRHTSKDTLSFLKAKRINRHKNLEGPQIKKSRCD